MSFEGWMLLAVFGFFCIEIIMFHRTFNQHYDWIIELRRMVQAIENEVKKGTKR